MAAVQSHEDWTLRALQGSLSLCISCSELVHGKTFSHRDMLHVRETLVQHSHDHARQVLDLFRVNHIGHDAASPVEKIGFNTQSLARVLEVACRLLQP